MASKNVLVIYHSLTGRTAEVMSRITQGLTDGGHHITERRIVTTEPWEFPLSRSKFLWRNVECWAGKDMNMPIEDLDFGDTDYDHVVLGTQTWHLNPAFPVSTFLDTDASEVLRGRNVTPVITCRNRWRSNLEILTRKILQRGGKVCGAYVLSDPPNHLMPTLFYLFNGQDPRPESFFDGRTGRPFDFSESDLETATAFGNRLAMDLSEGALPVPGENIIINDHE